MNSSKLADGILKRIKKEQIAPHSKLYFYAKNIGFWGIFALSVLVGAISFAVILYATTSTDFAVGEFIEEGEWLEQWLTLLPLIWVLLIGIAIGIGMVGLKHTKRGYKIALFTLIGSNILSSLVLGGGLYAAGGGELIEEILEENVEIYEGVRKKHQNFWGNPAQTGRLAGRVQTITANDPTFLLEGPYGRLWTIFYDQKKFSSAGKLEPGRIIKMKGTVESTDQFRPQSLELARRMENLQYKIGNYLQSHPQLRREFKQHLSPENQIKIDYLQKNKEQPSLELREQIRQDYRNNTTPAQREEMREEFRKSIQNSRAEGELPRRSQTH